MCALQALIVVIILGWLFVPIYIKAGVSPCLWLYARSSFGISRLCPYSAPSALPRTHFPKRARAPFHALKNCSAAPAGGHHARVPEEKVRRAAHSDLPLCAVAAALHLHEDLRESHGVPGASWAAVEPLEAMQTELLMMRQSVRFFSGNFTPPVPLGTAPVSLHRLSDVPPSCCLVCAAELEMFLKWIWCSRV